MPNTRNTYIIITMTSLRGVLGHGSCGVLSSGALHSSATFLRRLCSISSHERRECVARLSRRRRCIRFLSVCIIWGLVILFVHTGDHIQVTVESVYLYYSAII